MRTEDHWLKVMVIVEIVRENCPRLENEQKKLLDLIQCGAGHCLEEFQGLSDFIGCPLLTVLLLTRLFYNTV